jgi:ribonuclease D
MNYKLIKNNSELSSYLSTFEDQKCSIIALDTEAELNLHAYGETLCLVQIFDGVNKVLIDPFKIDRELLKSLFENRNILKVMYDAASDLSLMKNSYGIEIKSILDLRPAVSLLNFEKQDLHSVIASELGVFLENKAKFQQHNWTLRPICQEAIEYAISDVTYILELKDVLLKKIFESHLMGSYILNNLKIQNKDYSRNPADKYTRINGFKYLNADDKLVALEVGKIIEKYACEYNIPSHWIINKNDVIEIIKDPEYLNRIKFPNRFSKGSMLSILRELKSAAKKKLSDIRDTHRHAVRMDVESTIGLTNANPPDSGYRLRLLPPT